VENHDHEPATRINHRTVLVNGAAGIDSWRPGGPPFSVMGFTVRGGRIIEIDVLPDPARSPPTGFSVQQRLRRLRALTKSN
jgi:hypothetical protein